MSEIKKLGFGLMRLPQKSDNAADIDLEQFKQLVDLFLERGFTYGGLRRRDQKYLYRTWLKRGQVLDPLRRRQHDKPVGR